MKKIKSVFARNYEGDHLVRDEVVPGCEWVLDGKGVPTRKFDGTCCLVKDGKLFRRYDAKRGRIPPPTFIPAQEVPDPVTGHWPGWLPVDPANKADRWHIIAWQRGDGSDNGIAVGDCMADGTYELCGVHFQGNPEGIEDGDVFIRHGSVILPDMPRTFEGIRAFLAANRMEGIVFHRENGDMAKIKRTDFGFEWNGSTRKGRPTARYGA